MVPPIKSMDRFNRKIMEVEVNGIRYQRIEREPKPQSKALSTLVLMSVLMGGGVSSFTDRSNNYPKVDIVEEYKLIQQKKSNLSRRERNWVEYQFERNFKRVEEA